MKFAVCMTQRGVVLKAVLFIYTNNIAQKQLATGASHCKFAEAMFRTIAFSTLREEMICRGYNFATSSI